MSFEEDSKHFKKKQVKSDIQELLEDFKARITKGSAGVRQSGRAVLLSRGIDPLDLMIKTYEMAMKAYETGRGLSDYSDPGPSYLAVCSRVAHDMSKFVYPTIKPVEAKFQDLEEASKDGISREALSSKDIREAILADPFAQEIADGGKKQEEEMNALMNASIAAIATGEINRLESVLPGTPIETPPKTEAKTGGARRPKGKK